MDAANAAPERTALRALGALMRFTRGACAGCFAAFCLVTLAQVLNRYLFGLPMFWTEELVLLLFVWSVMLGLPAALWWREEIVVDIVQFSGRLETARRVLVDLISIGFLLALLWSGLAFTERGGISLSPALGLSRSVFYAAIPTGAALAALAMVGRLLRRSEPNASEDRDAALAHD